MTAVNYSGARLICESALPRKTALFVWSVRIRAAATEHMTPGVIRTILEVGRWRIEQPLNTVNLGLVATI